jgi:uncharacterized damage-inducible protein DinB
MRESTANLVEQYAAGGERLADVLRSWSNTDLRRSPPDSAGPEVGKWSVHQLVIHLADAELAFADRIRRVIAMDNPALLAWNENAFSERLHYEVQSTQDALELIVLTRQQLARVLRKLSDTDFERIGIHDQRGPQALSAIIGFADWHLNHHMAFVHRKRLALQIKD